MRSLANLLAFLLSFLDIKKAFEMQIKTINLHPLFCSLWQSLGYLRARQRTTWLISLLIFDQVHLLLAISSFWFYQDQTRRRNEIKRARSCCLLLVLEASRTRC